jgi:acetyl-CoA synthetase
MWQMPHFLAIAWMYRDEYAQAGFVMLRRDDRTGLATALDSLLCTLALSVFTVIPSVAGLNQSIYLSAAMGLDFVLLDDGRPASRGELFLVPPSIGLSNDLLNYDHLSEYFKDVPRGPEGQRLRRHGDQVERLGGGFYRHWGRIDDTINLNGVKTSSEEIRSVIGNESISDSKPISIDTEGTGQHRLVVYAVPRDPKLAGSTDLAERLRAEFERDIKQRLNPLLAHVEEVILVPELPQAGPGKTKTMRELRQEYATRPRRAKSTR